MAGALKEIDRSKDAEPGQAALEAFATSVWGRKYEAIAAAWQRHWTAVIPFFAFPDEVRRVISTTDEIDKRLSADCGNLFLRGRPRGEERGIDCKPRQAA